MKPYWFHLKGSFGRAGGGEGVVLGVELVVAQKLEQGSVIVVAAGLGEHVDLGGVAPELGGVNAGLHLELLQASMEGRIT